MKRYEVLAEDIAHSIRTGVLKLDDRLPSVRQASSIRGISASTVLEAYYLLESQGLIRSKERSGYYVAAGIKNFPPKLEFAATCHDGNSRPVDVCRLISGILESSKKREHVPLGAAVPSPLLFPMANLAKSMSAAVMKMDPWSPIDDISPGNEALRRQIALRYMVDGMHIHTNEIVITNGALEALHLCLMAVAKPGDAVVIESPAFHGTLQALLRKGMRPIELPTHPREGIDLEALETTLQRHRPKACWLMTNFQNPMGSLMPDDKKRALVSLLSQFDVPLIEDDAYGELYFGNKRPMPAKAFDTKGLVMHCGSFSKSLAPGYRVGWVASGRYAKSVAMMKFGTSISACVPAQAALADYLSKGRYELHLKQLRHKLSLQQKSMIQAVDKYFPPGTRCTRPGGGYFLWVELPATVTVNTVELHHRALAIGISIAPGPMFSSQGHFSNCLRLNYGYPWDTRFEAAIETLGMLIKQLSE